MAAEAYTLILTQGVHTVRPDVAETIRAAIQNGERMVEIDIDLFGGLEMTPRILDSYAVCFAWRSCHAVGVR